MGVGIGTITGRGPAQTDDGWDPGLSSRAGLGWDGWDPEQGWGAPRSTPRGLWGPRGHQGGVSGLSWVPGGPRPTGVPAALLSLTAN